VTKRNYGLPNPEDPLSGMEDYWEPPPPSRFWWAAIWVLIIVTVLGLVAAFVLRPASDWL